MPIGNVWIYRLLFVFLFVYSTVTDFSSEDKVSCVKFCTVVHRRPGPGVSHFGELSSPRSPKSKWDICGCAIRMGLDCTRGPCVADSSNALATGVRSACVDKLPFAKTNVLVLNV